MMNTKLPIKQLVDIYITENLPDIPEKLREKYTEIKTRDLTKFLTWLNTHYLILDKPRIMRIIENLNAAYENGNEDPVGVRIGELTEYLQERNG